MFRPFLLAASLIWAGTAQADIAVTFSEGAPKDRFSFTSTDACLSGPVEITVDLSGSQSGLIFDVTGQGAGVEVFQPFELVSGGDLVTQSSGVRDGDNKLSLSLSALPEGSIVGFTIDVDDTVGTREITVNGAEITGASVTVRANDAVATGIFDASATALVKMDACLS